MTTTRSISGTRPAALVVEDDEAQRKTICDILEEEGIRPIGCATATEALVRIERDQVAVAIVDLRLPDLDGTRVLERLRRTDEGIRVIIHTAYGSFESARDAVNLGAFAYVEKLSDPRELLGHVQRAVRERLQKKAEDIPELVFQLDWRGTIGPDMERVLQSLVGDNILVETVQPEQLSPVRAELDEIERVILQLVINARDAMPGGGRLTIETANVELGPADVAGHEGARPGPHVAIAIHDTGEGMSEPTLKAMFDPYFTTRADRGGVGLGLAEVYAIVARAGGHIAVESEPGQGTTVRVFLPADAG